MLGKKKSKKSASCPKKEGDEWKNYFGKAPKDSCKKCVPAYKLSDYLDAVNKSRSGDATFIKSCKKILLDPLVHKVKIPKAYKGKIHGKPYKNCLMRNQIFRSGRKGAKKLLRYIKSAGAKKLHKFKPDPCQSYNNYVHAKYMAKSKCLTHTEAKGGKASDEKCDGAGARLDWRERSLKFGKFKGGTEIIGVIPSKFGFNPTLLACIVGLDDADPKKTNRKALHHKKHNFFGIGTFKKGSSIYYSISLTSHTICKKESKILGKKKWTEQMGIDKKAFGTLKSDVKAVKKKK